MNHCGFDFMYLFMFQIPLIKYGGIYSRASVVMYAGSFNIIYDTYAAPLLLSNASL